MSRTNPRATDEAFASIYKACGAPDVCPKCGGKLKRTTAETLMVDGGCRDMLVELCLNCTFVHFPELENANG